MDNNEERGKVTTRDLLLSRTECLRQGLRVQRDKIEAIVKGKKYCNVGTSL